MADCCTQCSNVVLPIGETGPQGPQGNPGTNGTDGTSILFNYPSEEGGPTFIANETNAAETVGTYIIPANSLEANGELVEIDAMFYLNRDISGDDAVFNIKIGSTSLLGLSFPLTRDEVEVVKFKIFVNRNNDGTALITYDYQTNKFIYFFGVSTGFAEFNNKISLIKPIVITGLDFTANINITVNTESVDAIGLFNISQFTGTLKKY